MRISLPEAVITITCSRSSTAIEATTLPLRSLVRMLMIPEPPRPCSRYSSTGVRLP